MAILKTELWRGVGITYWELIQFAIAIVVTAVVTAVVRVVLTRLSKRFDRNEQDLQDDLFRAVRLPAVLMIWLSGLYLALYQIQKWQPFIVAHKRWFGAVVTLFVIIAIARCAGLAIQWYGVRSSEAGGPPGQMSLIRKIVTLAIWLLGAIQIMTGLGYQIGAILASLGIASLAVALALQDTIANLFAGMYIVADRSIRAGDYVKLENGDEGFVEQVGWRNTRIRLWANNIVLVPNNKLVQSTITNMTLPNPVLSVYTWCGVSYDSDLEEVERVTLDVANHIINSFPGADLSYEPVVRFKEFGDSNISFVVIFRAIEVGAQYLLQHEFVKALHKRFREEGIEISFPVRKLVWQEHVSLPVEAVMPSQGDTPRS